MILELFDSYNRRKNRNIKLTDLNPKYTKKFLYINYINIINDDSKNIIAVLKYFFLTKKLFRNILNEKIVLSSYKKLSQKINEMVKLKINYFNEFLF